MLLWITYGLVICLKVRHCHQAHTHVSYFGKKVAVEEAIWNG